MLVTRGSMCGAKAQGARVCFWGHGGDGSAHQQAFM